MISLPGLAMVKNEKIDDYMNLQPEVTKRARTILIEWLIEVQDVLKVTNETLYLAINIIDRFLAAETITIKEFQCVGITAMFIALKYQETCHGFRQDVNEFVDFCDGAYERQDVLAMEIRILDRLGWKLSSLTTPYSFLTSDTITENMVYFYAELGIMNYKIVTRFRPSIVAAAAWYATCATLHKRYICHETFKMQTRLHEKLAMQCAKIMVESHSLLKSNNRRTQIYHKYSSKTRGAVALYPPAKSLLPCHRWRI